MKSGYWIDFCCPKCKSVMFGSSWDPKTGKWIRMCHGNEKWHCDYSASEDLDKNHFKKYININHEQPKTENN